MTKNTKRIRSKADFSQSNASQKFRLKAYLGAKDNRESLNDNESGYEEELITERVKKLKK